MRYCLTMKCCTSLIRVTLRIMNRICMFAIRCLLGSMLCLLLVAGSVLVYHQWTQLMKQRPTNQFVTYSSPARGPLVEQALLTTSTTSKTPYSMSTVDNDVTRTPRVMSTQTVKVAGDNHDEIDVGEDKPEDEVRNPSSTSRPRATTSVAKLQPTTTTKKTNTQLVPATLRGHRQPSQPHVIRGRWQLVEGSQEIYIMSAFYDQREATIGGHVRVIGVADKDVTEVYCLLWFLHTTIPEAVLAELISIGPTIAPNAKTVYEQLIFSCLVSDVNVPVNVSLVTSHNKFRPSTLLPVQVPVKPSSPSKVIEFGHCMSVMYKRQDPYRLVEWLELHRMWGVSEVNIYTTAVDNITERILGYYGKSGFVHHEKIPSAVDETDSNESAILLNMSPVINDCLYRNLYRYKYIVCTDIDEMIVPKTARNYSAMLKQASSGNDFHSFLFRNAYFFLDFGGITSEPWYLLTQRYMKRVRPSRFGYSSKSITRTLSCIGLQNHLCWKRLPVLEHHTTWNLDVPTKVGKSHHYKKCHFDEYHNKNGVCLKMMMKSSSVDKTMVQFGDVLADRVIHKLIELDLAEPSTDDSWKAYNPIP